MTRYCTADELKSPLRTVGHSTRATDDVEAVLDAASRWIDRYFNLVAGAFAQSVPSARRFDVGRQKGALLTLDMPLLSITSITNGNGASVPTVNTRLIPRNDPPYTAIRLMTGYWIASYVDEIEVTGLWGYSHTVPAIIREATAILAVWIVNEYQTRRGTEGLSLEKEGEIKAVDVPPLLHSLLAPIHNHLRQVRHLS